MSSVAKLALEAAGVFEPQGLKRGQNLLTFCPDHIFGEGDLRSVRDPDHQGSGKPGSCAYYGEQPSDPGAE